MNELNNFGNGFSNVGASRDVRVACPQCGRILKKSELIKVEHPTRKVLLGLFPAMVTLCEECVRKSNNAISRKSGQATIPGVLE